MHAATVAENTDIVLRGLGWAVLLSWLFLVGALFLLRRKPKPTVRTYPQTYLSEADHARIFRSVTSPTLSAPAKKGFAKNYQRHV